MRIFGVGRKKWRPCASNKSPERLAVFYTVLITAKMHNADLAQGSRSFSTHSPAGDSTVEEARALLPDR